MHEAPEWKLHTLSLGCCQSEQCAKEALITPAGMTGGTPQAAMHGKGWKNDQCCCQENENGCGGTQKDTGDPPKTGACATPLHLNGGRRRSSEARQPTQPTALGHCGSPHLDPNP